METLGNGVIINRSKKNDPSKMKKHITNFFKWLINIQEFNYDRKDKNEFLFLLVQLKKQLSYSIPLLNVPPSNQKQTFNCDICSEKITLEPFQDIWECLETHCHTKSSVNFSNTQKKNETISETVIDKKNEAAQSGCSINETRLQDEVNFKEDTETADSEENFEELLVENNNSVESVSENSPDMVFNERNSSPNKSRLWYPNKLIGSLDNIEKEFNSYMILEKKQPTNWEATSKNESRETEVEIENFPSCSIENRPEPGGNGFLFKFQTNYDKNIESKLYPKFYRKFDLQGDPILQKTGSERTVCLTCGCELLGQNCPPSIVSHMSGTRHTQIIASDNNVKNVIQAYHDNFLRLNKEYQSHQIYFATDDDANFLKCVACLKYVKHQYLQAHIVSELHKKKLIQLSSEPKMHSLFYFLKEHIESYGVKCDSKKVDNEAVEEKPKRIANNKRHNIVKSTNNSDPIKLPGRFDKHLKFLRVALGSISCNACEKNETFNWNNIRLHLVQPSHLVATNTTTLNYIYHCDVCDKKFHDEIAWNLHFKDELIRHNRAQYEKNEQFFEYECSTCKLVLYGDSASLEKHKQSNPFKRTERNRSVTLAQEVKEFFCSRKVIRENGIKLVEDAQSTSSRTDLVLKCCEDLENALRGKYSFCKAYPFGSRVSGLGCKQSDLDIFVDIGYMYNGFQNQDERDQTMIITNVLILIKKRPEFTQINCIPAARTPIIQLKHKSTNLDCDISFMHGLSVENTKFLRYCFELQPAAQKLILLIKKWSHLCGLNDSITTYALAMLAIFYLQKKNYLLSVQALKEMNKQNVSIGGWETIDYVTAKEEVLKKFEIFRGDIVHLLAGFFKFYAEFNYKLYVVCPLMGTEISKCAFSSDPKGGALPKAMSSYVRKINTDSSPEYFRCLSHFCVQDPFDLSHNLTKACSSVLLNKFVRFCTLTHQMLTSLED